MFDKYIIDTSGNERAAMILAESNANHDATLRAISDAEIKSKDRVDIPLSEYDRLRKENSDLRWRVDRMEIMLAKMGIPKEVIDTIDPDSIEVLTCKDPRYFRTKYQVLFVADDYKEWTK